jgi:GH35 family endo-1,4-beta-xylanase
MLRACGLVNAGNLTRIFGWARDSDPAAQLCLTEGGVLDGNNWEGFVELAKSLQAAGAPVDCLGLEVGTTGRSRLAQVRSL